MPPQTPLVQATVPPQLAKLYAAGKKLGLQKAKHFKVLKAHVPKIKVPGPLIRQGMKPVLPKPNVLLNRGLRAQRHNLP